MSFLSNLAKAASVHRRKLLFAGAIAGLFGAQSAGFNPLASLFRTPGVKNIEGRYTAGGGGPNHQPGAATPRGNQENAQGNVLGRQGVGSEKFKEEIGEQKPDPGPFKKAWNEAQHGQERGK